MRKLLHRIAHLFGWNHGQIVSGFLGRDVIIGYRCECGRVAGLHNTRTFEDVEPTPEIVRGLRV